MKYSVQNCNNSVIVMQVLSVNAAQKIAGGYYEQCAIGYNTHNDGLELIILSRGNGSSDDRVLADQDSDETIAVDTLTLAAQEIEQIAKNHVNQSELLELADYVERQAKFLFDYRYQKLIEENEGSQHI